MRMLDALDGTALTLVHSERRSVASKEGSAIFNLKPSREQGRNRMNYPKPQICRRNLDKWVRGFPR